MRTRLKTKKKMVGDDLKNPQRGFSFDKSSPSKAILEILPKGRQQTINFNPPQQKEDFLKPQAEGAFTIKGRRPSLEKKARTKSSIIKAKTRAKYSKALLKDVLRWLNLQPHQFATHIKDMDVAVKMYLKAHKHSKKPEEKKSQREEELKQLLAQGANGQKQSKKDGNQNAPAVVLTNKQYSFDFSLPASSGQQEAEDASKKMAKATAPVSSATAFSSSSPSLDAKQSLFALDERSLQTLRKTKEDFNLEKDADALRLLIQMGRKQMDKSFSSS